MKPAIIITSGATSEKIDGELRLINTSHNDFGRQLVEDLIERHYGKISKIYFLTTDAAYAPILNTDKVDIFETPTADDMLTKLRDLGKSLNISAVIHTANTATPKTTYAIQPFFLAEQLWNAIQEQRINSVSDINNILTAPKNCYFDMNLSMAPGNPDFLISVTPTVDILPKLRNIFKQSQIIGMQDSPVYNTPFMYKMAAELRGRVGTDYIISRHMSDNYPNESQAIVAGKYNVYRVCPDIDATKWAVIDLITGNQ